MKQDPKTKRLSNATKQPQEGVTTMLTYANLKSAKQAAKRKNMKNPEFIETPDGRIMAREKGSALYNADLRVKSECNNPVATVWDLCFAQPKAKRRDIVAKAIEAGVSLNTARTQYQYWRAAAGLAKSRKGENAHA